MNVTAKGIAVALAVIVVFGFFLFGLVNPFSGATPTVIGAPEASSTTNQSLMITDFEEGMGVAAAPGNTVVVNYEGKLEDGTVFDASSRHGQPFSFVLGAGQVIKGWDEGLLGMKVGGKRRLVIPPEMGYGAQAVGGVIPPNSTLIFDVELLEVK